MGAYMHTHTSTQTVLVAGGCGVTGSKSCIATRQLVHRCVVRRVASEACCDGDEIGECCRRDVYMCK